MPLPVDAGYFAPQPERGGAGRIVFTGMLDHPPNVDAAVFFARDVLPRVRARVPNAEFHIVGRRPRPEVLALAPLQGVRVTADVDDIRPALAGASVFVVPLRYGAGARQKILEAWCMERCVVSTAVGAEGLEVADGANIAIADGVDWPAAATIRALEIRPGGTACGAAGGPSPRRPTIPGRVAAGTGTRFSASCPKERARTSRCAWLLDLRWMLPGRAGGIENLARSFFRELLALDRHNRYTTLIPARCRHDFDLRDTRTSGLLSPDRQLASPGVSPA